MQSTPQNLDLISLAEAKRISGYNQDHLDLLCRTGKLQGQKIGRSWVVSRQALLAFMEVKGIAPKVVLQVPTEQVVENAPQEPQALPEVFAAQPVPVATVVPVKREESVQVVGQAGARVSFGRVFAAVAAVVLFVLTASVVHLWQSEQGGSQMLVDRSDRTYGTNRAEYDNENDYDQQGGVGQKNDDDNNHDSDPAQRGDQQGIVLGDSTLVPLAGSGTGQASGHGQGSSSSSSAVSAVPPIPSTLNPSPSVIDFSRLSISEYELNALIAQQLTNLASIGLLGSAQGSSSSPYNSTTYNSTTPSAAPAPVITYIQPAPAQNFSGASLLSATDLSSTRFTTTTANVTDTATIKTLSVTENANVAGDLTVAGTVNATVNGTLQPNFTQGSIAFQGASGLTQDNAGLYYDNANNRLGLGTTTPLAVLDVRQQVNGQPVINAQRATNTAPTGNFITYKDASGNTLYSVDNSGNVTAAGIASSSALTVTATTTPQLRVQYNSSNEWTSSTNSTGTTTFAFNGSAPKAAFITQSNSTAAFEFQNVDGNAVLSVDTLNGNVGIGAGNAQGALEVRSNGSPYFVVDPAGTKQISLGDLEGNFNGNAIQLDMQNDWTDFGGFYNANGFGGFINRAASTVQWGDGGAGFGTVFTVNDAAQKFTFENGNVGIGTSTPQFALDIQGQSPQLVIQASSPTANIPAFTLKNDTGKYVQMWTAGSGAWHANRSLTYASALDFFADGNLGDGNINFYTNTPGTWVDVPKVTFAASGNVGIGTTSPSAPLHIVVNSLQSGLKLQRTAATAASYDLYIGSDGRLGVYDYAASQDRLRVDTNGQITVGSQNQNAQLGVVNGNAATPALKLRAAAAQSSDLFTVTNSAGTQVGVRVRNDGILSVGTETTNTVYNGSSGVANIVGPSGYWGIRTSTANAFNIDMYNSGTPIAAFTVLQNGNVGIGTTSPSEKLTISGNGLFTGTYPYVSLAPTGWSGSTFYFQSGVNNIATTTGDYTAYVNPAGKGYSWLQATTARMVIDTAGNVGIGTTVPTEKLHVSGNAPSIRLEHTGGYDIQLHTNDGAGNPGLRLPEGGTMSIQDSGNTIFGRVSGNVGIGTTTPGSLLHVAGGIRTSNDAAGILTLGRMDDTDEGAQIDWTGAGNGAGADWDNWATDIYQNSFRIFTNTANTNQVQIMNAGAGAAGLYVESNVGIGTTTPSQLLHVYRATGGVVARFTDSDGSCDIDPTSTALVCSSDANLKTDITTLSGVLPKLQGMRGVSFRWKTQEDAALRIGVLAQEVEPAFPELVKTDSQTGKKSVNYTGLAPILLQAVKEQQDEIAALQNQIALLQGMNSLSGTMPITLTSHLYLSTDSVGQARILAGSTSVRVTFDRAYEEQPIVTATANGRVGSEYWVGEKDATGFTLYIESPAATDITFDWHAFASPSAKLTVSDGTTQQLLLVLPPQSAPENPLPGEVAGESAGNDYDNNDDNDPAPLEDSGTGQATVPAPTPSPTPTPDS